MKTEERREWFNSWIAFGSRLLSGAERHGIDPADHSPSDLFEIISFMDHLEEEKQKGYNGFQSRH